MKKCFRSTRDCLALYWVLWSSILTIETWKHGYLYTKIIKISVAGGWPLRLSGIYLVIKVYIRVQMQESDSSSSVSLTSLGWNSRTSTSLFPFLSFHWTFLRTLSCLLDIPPLRGGNKEFDSLSSPSSRFWIFGESKATRGLFVQLIGSLTSISVDNPTSPESLN